MGHNCPAYADDIIIYHTLTNRYLDLAITSINNALESLWKALTIFSFPVTHNKCKATIFTKRPFIHCAEITINGVLILVVTNHTHLGLKI